MNILFWILEYSANFIEFILCIFFTKVFIDDKQSFKPHLFIYALIISCIVLATNIIELFSYIIGMLNLTFLLITQFIIYRKKYATITLATIIYAFIISVIDFTVIQIFSLIINIKSKYLLEQQNIERCLCLIISKSILFLIIYFIYRYSNIKMFLSKKYIFIISFISVILLTFNYYLIKKNELTTNPEIQVLSATFFISSILLISLIFGLILKISENYNQKQNIALLELQNEMLIKAEQNTEQIFQLWRSSIHDYKHKIFLLKYWMDNEDLKSLKTFVNNENNIFSQKLFYIKTGNDIIDALINTKQKLAEENNIIFSTNISIPSHCSVSDLDFICILGNLIDNALEACENQNQKYIDLTIKEINHLLIIKVINSYKDMLPKKFITTKKDKSLHGIGLENVKNLVKKYNGSYKISQNQDEVITIITLKNSE